MFTGTVNSSWDERSRRGLTTLTSFGVQALIGGALLLLPLLRPAGLPSLRQLSTPVSLVSRWESPSQSECTRAETPPRAILRQSL